ncbi:MAG: deoxynucleoside kinase [Anaerolineaceae bacterium]|jgi:deoxyadenosine/deoxycytidine kinase|nr:deoxynucleoside kinase [Anaerolineaceae bacterium]
MKKFITVAGNIGVGKSSLVLRLSERLKWQPFFEPEANNPYLADFYQDMHAWSFHSQMFFLGHRLRVYRDLTECPNSVILDRSLYEDAEIFAHNLFINGYMTRRDYDTYDALYQSLLSFLPAPDLVIYLRASVSTLVERINQRSRNYEHSIDAGYLEQLNNAYDVWISGFSLCPVLTIPADNLDFVYRSNHLELILSKVQEKIAGKDEVIFLPDEYTS